MTPKQFFETRTQKIFYCNKTTKFDETIFLKKVKDRRFAPNFLLTECFIRHVSHERRIIVIHNSYTKQMRSHSVVMRIFYL